MILIIYNFILAAVSAFREIEILIERGSWNSDITWLKFWKTKLFNIPNTDSFHFAWGLWWLLIVVAIVFNGIWVYLFGEFPVHFYLIIFGKSFWFIILSVIINSILYWQMYMYFRNVCMHIVFMKKDSMRLSYLSPIKF